MTPIDPPRIEQPASKLCRRRSLARAMEWDADLPADLVDQLWRDPQAVLAGGRKLQVKQRCTVVLIDHPAGQFVFKQHHWGTVARRARKSLSRSSARKSWLDAHHMLAEGVPTPRPRAYVESRIGPCSTCSYLLTNYVPGTTLYRLMRFDQPSSELVANVAAQLASIWQRLDELRVCHNDLKPENVLVDPAGKVWLIDVEKMRRYARLDRARARQVRDAADLLHPRNWRASPSAAEVFRGAILRTPAAAETLAGPLGSTHPLGRELPCANAPSHLVTVLIPCRNAVETIDACLASVRDMADEILVADAGSTDGTLERVRAFGGCRIIERDGACDVSFESWVAGVARHPWILRVLPNERLSPELGRQVQDLLATDPIVDGFRISRSVQIRGQQLLHCGFSLPPQVRLYRGNTAEYIERAGEVDVLVSRENTGRLTSHLLCEWCPSVGRHLADTIHRARRTAEALHRQDVAPRRFAALVATPWQFFRSYVLQGGCLDGWAGLHACWFESFSRFLTETFLWELESQAAQTRANNALRRLRVFDPSQPTPEGSDGELQSSGADPQQHRSAA